MASFFWSFTKLVVERSIAHYEVSAPLYFWFVMAGMISWLGRDKPPPEPDPVAHISRPLHRHRKKQMKKYVKYVTSSNKSPPPPCRRAGTRRVRQHRFERDEAAQPAPDDPRFRIRQEALHDLATRIDAFAHTITLKRVPPPQSKEGEEPWYPPRNVPRSTSRDMPAAHQHQLSDTQRANLVRYGPTFIANMDKEERDALPPALRDPFVYLHEERHGIPHTKGMDGEPVIWDTGASASISPNLSDFVGPLERVPWSTKLFQLTKGVRVHSKGHLAWSFIDVEGMLRTVKTPGLYVPKSKVRLLSITALLRCYPNETISMSANELVLSGSKEGNQKTNAIRVLVDPTNNLPTALAYNLGLSDLSAGYNASVPTTFDSGATTNITSVSLNNGNLTEPEKELLRWHYRLGHLGFRKIQLLMRSGVLANSESKRRLHSACCRINPPPICSACQFAKQTVRSPGSTVHHPVSDRAGALSRDTLLPGQRTSVDHFICSTPGRLPSSRGGSSNQYTGGCIFVDHASGHIDVEFQTHLNSHETVKAKEQYELRCRDNGVIPQEYLTDNGAAFTSREYTNHLGDLHQHARASGVGAHHQNGRAERAIRTIMSIARAMLLHAAIHWPEASNAALWPMAVQQAVYIWNRMPAVDTGLSPLDIFSRTRWPQSKLQDLHVWGCPVYVLHKRIADGQKLPRWTPRTERYVYVGTSTRHASTVPLVLNLRTGAITPQYNVVFDDWFATVTSDPSTLPDLHSRAWLDLFGSDALHHIDEDDEEDADEGPSSQTQSHTETVRQAFDSQSPARPLDNSSARPVPQREPTIRDANQTPNCKTPTTLQREDDDQDPPPLDSPPTRLIDSIESLPTPANTSPQREMPMVVPIPSASPSPSPQREMHTPIQPTRLSVPPPTSAPPRAPSTLVPTDERALLRRSSRNRSVPKRHGYDGTQGQGYHAESHHAESQYLASQYHILAAL